MAGINLSTVMDAIGDTITASGLMTRVYPWPAEQVTVPCAVVGYPTDLEFDVTFRRGSDRAVFPVYLMVGKAVERTSRDQLSALIADPTGIKNALDGTLGGAVQTARLRNLKVEEVSVAGVAYLAAVGELEVFS